MKVLVDTCVWSKALRRKKIADDPFVNELRVLIEEIRVQMIGPIRQELLSGIRSQSQFENVRNHLRAFPDLELTTSDYERAVELFDTSLRKGIQGSNTDFLICAVSEQHDMPILTTDQDFTLFQHHIPLKLHAPRVK
ncbi:MAG: PIN domain-containing protein [Desulfobacterales bacterium]|nr:PIN domain-containing protein [Desulfobacterales bacterium]